MRYAGRSLTEAIDSIMTATLEANMGGLIGVSSRGEIVMQHNTPGMSCGAADGGGRFEIFLLLDNGGGPEDSGQTADADRSDSEN
jgi:beta-aspartyl-peptidase (threonine type)